MAPPRPPKSIPRVHRPRAPEPDIVDSPSIQIISSNIQRPGPPPIPSHPKPITNSNLSTKITTTMSSNQNISSSINSSLSSINSHRSIPPIPPATAPLSALSSQTATNINNRNQVSTFSRRRTDVITAPITVPPRSLTPSSVVAPATNFISNALSTVVGRSSSPVNNGVTLQVPRPENERITNEYVDTPFSNNKLNAPGSRHSLATSTVTSRNQLNHSHHHNNHHLQQNHHQNNHLHSTNISTIDEISNNNNNNNSKIILPNRTISTLQRPNVLPITKQPSFRNTTLSKKDAGLHPFSHCPEDSTVQNATNNNDLMSSASDPANSIMCPQCNRCMCKECQQPRQLPSKWICDDNCLCSAETIIDYASCLCCVKALFYHCSKDHDHELDSESETIRCAEDPCSCVPYKRSSRWGCLSVLSVLLPCLCCYWPMRGCVSLCAKCYAKHRRHGCRCNNNKSSPSSAINSTNNSFNSRQNIIGLASPTSQDQPTYNHRRNNNDLTPEKRLLDSSEY
jgi:protein sprouty homolog 2